MLLDEALRFVPCEGGVLRFPFGDEGVLRFDLGESEESVLFDRVDRVPP